MFFFFFFSGWTGANERTFIAVKPDGVQRRLVGEIVRRFERKGFKLVGMKLLQVRAPLEYLSLSFHNENEYYIIRNISSVYYVLVGIRGAAQTALLGPEGEAFLQQLGQVHELRSHCCYGKKHCASVLVQERISVLMLLWRHLMVCQTTLYVGIYVCFIRYGKGWMW